jgi:hypothetical protein
LLWDDDVGEKGGGQRGGDVGRGGDGGGGDSEIAMLVGIVG